MTRAKQTFSERSQRVIERSEDLCKASEQLRLRSEYLMASAEDILVRAKNVTDKIRGGSANWSSTSRRYETPSGTKNDWQRVDENALLDLTGRTEQLKPAQPLP